MKNKYKIKIDSVSYKKLQKKLQKYNIKIGGISLSNFLIANSVNDDSSDSPGIRVKRIILHIAGDFDRQPQDMESESHLELDFLFGHHQYLLLRRKLDHLVKEYNKESKISANEAYLCHTVGDCVDLVHSKILRKSF
jgi:hypothetical protein